MTSHQEEPGPKRRRVENGFKRNMPGESPVIIEDDDIDELAPNLDSRGSVGGGRIFQRRTSNGIPTQTPYSGVGRVEEYRRVQALLSPSRISGKREPLTVLASQPQQADSSDEEAQEELFTRRARQQRVMSPGSTGSPTELHPAVSDLNSSSALKSSAHGTSGRMLDSEMSSPDALQGTDEGFGYHQLDRVPIHCASATTLANSINNSEGDRNRISKSLPKVVKPRGESQIDLSTDQVFVAIKVKYGWIPTDFEPLSIVIRKAEEAATIEIHSKLTWMSRCVNTYPRAPKDHPWRVRMWNHQD